MAKAKNNWKDRMCKGKVGHDTKDGALIAVYKMRRADLERGTPRATRLTAYRCHCGKWHLGHSKHLDWTYLDKVLHPAKAI